MKKICPDQVKNARVEIHCVEGLRCDVPSLSVNGKKHFLLGSGQGLMNKITRSRALQLARMN